jgi:hypothetical protein
MKKRKKHPGAERALLLSSEYATYKAVKARFRP